MPRPPPEARQSARRPLLPPRARRNAQPQRNPVPQERRLRAATHFAATDEVRCGRHLERPSCVAAGQGRAGHGQSKSLPSPPSTSLSGTGDADARLRVSSFSRFLHFARAATAGRGGGRVRECRSPTAVPQGGLLRKEIVRGGVGAGAHPPPPPLPRPVPIVLVRVCVCLLQQGARVVDACRILPPLLPASCTLGILRAGFRRPTKSPSGFGGGKEGCLRARRLPNGRRGTSKRAPPEAAPRRTRIRDDDDADDDAVFRPVPPPFVCLMLVLAPYTH
eukprot:364937-Chlamydomonas_euryale.AAC.28